MTKRNPVWFIAVHDTTTTDAEDAAEDKGRVEVEKKQKVENTSCEVRTFLWRGGRSRFLAQARPGDLVIEAFTDDEGNTKISRPTPIRHHKNIIGNKTWFYLETPPGETYPWEWEEIRGYFEGLGVNYIRPTSVRELTRRALDILPYLDSATRA